MRIALLLYFFVMITCANAQNKFEWSENYKLTLDDFLGSGTEVGKVNMYSLQSGAVIDFQYQMTKGEFMMTKNWNEKVRCMFDRDHSYLVAPNDSIAQALINFARFEFDLAELHCRRLRKSIFEEKKWTSNASMFQPLYDRAQREFLDMHTKVSKETDIGLKADVLKSYHEQVLAEIRELPDFCRTCKPSKKKS